MRERAGEASSPARDSDAKSQGLGGRGFAGPREDTEARSQSGADAGASAAPSDGAGVAIPAGASATERLEVAARLAAERGADYSGSTPLRRWALARHGDYKRIMWQRWESMVQAIGATALLGAILQVERAAAGGAVKRDALLISIVAGALDVPAQLAEWHEAGAAAWERVQRPRSKPQNGALPVTAPDADAARMKALSGAAWQYVESLTDDQLSAEWAACVEALGIDGFNRSYIERHPRSSRHVQTFLAPWLHRTGAIHVPELDGHPLPEPGPHAPDYAALRAERQRHGALT